MHLNLVERSEERLRFRNGRWHGWVFVGIGIAFASASLATSDLEAWFLLLFSLPCLGAGMWTVLARCELTLDLLARRWEGCRGHWPSPATFRGSFDEIENVVLRRCRRSRGKRGGSRDRDMDWLVVLQLAGWPPVSIFWSRNEDAAVEKFEHYARLLGVPAVDRSGRSRSVEVQDILERLDRVTPEPSTAWGRPSSPPAGAAVTWHDDGNAVTIELKRGGYTGGAWFPLVFGASFFTAGVTFLSTGFAWGLGLFFSLAGLGILAMLTIALCSRQVVREAEREILFELNMLGWPLHAQRWPKNEVERVVRMKVPIRVPAHGPTIAENEQLGPQAAEVIVRRGNELVRLARGADDQTQQWLCQTLQQLVAR